MLIILRAQIPKEFYIEVNGDESIQDIINILKQDFAVDPDQYYLTLGESLEHIKADKTLKELDAYDGFILTMKYVSDLLETEKGKSLTDTFRENRRTLLPPKTTQNMLDSMSPEEIEELKKKKPEITSDPPNFNKLVLRLTEDGYSREDAERALRENNYDFVEASLYLEDNTSGTNTVAGGKRETDTSDLAAFSQEEQIFLRRLIKKYNDVSVVVEVFMACDRVEAATANVLSEYFDTR